jgi:hypothetical protein
MDDDQFNMNIRQFLKKVGITSQREIETAVRSALDGGAITGTETLDVRVRLSVESLSLDVAIDGKIGLE